MYGRCVMARRCKVCVYGYEEWPGLCPSHVLSMSFPCPSRLTQSNRTYHSALLYVHVMKHTIMLWYLAMNYISEWTLGRNDYPRDTRVNMPVAYRYVSRTHNLTRKHHSCKYWDLMILENIQDILVFMICNNCKDKYFCI